MVNTCVVPGCSSGYASNKSEKVSLHRFPVDINKRNWTSSANSAICERHFLPSDYVTKRDDKQSRRVKKKGTDLIYRKLKPDAVPSVWPGLPHFIQNLRQFQDPLLWHAALLDKKIFR